MNYTIEAVAADGTRAQATLTANGTRFPAEPGTQYRIRDIDGSRDSDGVRIVRDGNDLTINGLPDTGEVRLEGFFTACTPEFSCSLLTEDLGGLPGEAITPASEPIAALTGGDFLMWSNGAREAAIPAAPESEYNWRPVAAVAGGLAVLGAGLGGGGGGGAVAADSTPPVAPLFKVDAPSNSAAGDQRDRRGEQHGHADRRHRQQRQPDQLFDPGRRQWQLADQYRHPGAVCRRDAARGAAGRPAVGHTGHCHRRLRQRRAGR
ncbi:MAG: hypothetical protein R3E68_07080 [Burkholderiaceae bacterium]